MALLSKAVNNIRRAQHKELTALNDDIQLHSEPEYTAPHDRVDGKDQVTFDARDSKLKAASRQQFGAKSLAINEPQPQAALV